MTNNGWAFLYKPVKSESQLRIVFPTDWGLLLHIEVTKFLIIIVNVSHRICCTWIPPMTHHHEIKMHKRKKTLKHLPCLFNSASTSQHRALHLSHTHTKLQFRMIMKLVIFHSDTFRIHTNKFTQSTMMHGKYLSQLPW